MTGNPGKWQEPVETAHEMRDDLPCTVPAPNVGQLVQQHGTKPLRRPLERVLWKENTGPQDTPVHGNGPVLAQQEHDLSTHPQFARAFTQYPP